MSPQRISLQTLKYSLCKGHLHLLGLKAKAMGLPHRGPTSWERQDSDHLQIGLQGNRDFLLYLPSQLQYTAMATPNLIWMAKTYTNLYGLNNSTNIRVPWDKNLAAKHKAQDHLILLVIR